MRDVTLLTDTAQQISSQDPAANPYIIASAYRTLQVLQAFAAAPHRFSLAELGRRTGLEKNQLYRSLKTLEHAGFLATDQEGRFALTPLLHVLSSASAHMQKPSLVEVAKPFMDELVAETCESVNLFIRASDYAVCIDRRDSPQLVRLASVLGRAVPLHAGAVPKAMLAFLPKEQQERTLARLHELPAYTSKTVLDPDRLRRELEVIRERGYSVSDEDYDDSARGVGAPIFDDRGDVFAGISVGGPSFRVDDDALERFAQLITCKAAAISQRLGRAG
jgi:DNA-binding IclR family transcriptional regulator